MLKRIIKLSVSIVNWIFLVLLNRTKGYCTIIYYHEVNRDELSRFYKQIQFLSKKTISVDIKSDIVVDSKKRYSLITFDDGFKSVFDNGLSVLEKLDIPMIMFVPSNYLGREPSWEKEKVDIAENDSILSEKELMLLSSNPLVTIGSHTRNHTNLTNVETDIVNTEIQQSKTELENIIGESVDFLSFPYGAFNNKVLSECIKCGYKNVFSTLPEAVNFKNNNFLYGRIGVTPKDWMIEFKLKVYGAYNWLPKVIELKKRVRNRK